MDKNGWCTHCIDGQHDIETKDPCRCNCHPAGQPSGKPGAKTRKNRSGKARRNLVAALLVRDGDHCHWCDIRFDDDWPPTVDHIIPRSHGGRNSRDNAVLACSWCNEKRGNKTAEEFRTWLDQHGPFPLEQRRNHWKKTRAHRHSKLSSCDNVDTTTD